MRNLKLKKKKLETNKFFLKKKEILEAIFQEFFV